MNEPFQCYIFPVSQQADAASLSRAIEKWDLADISQNNLSEHPTEGSTLMPTTDAAMLQLSLDSNVLSGCACYLHMREKHRDHTRQHRRVTSQQEQAAECSAWWPSRGYLPIR